MSTRPITILFLCTHNSARSIMAEALMNHLGEGRLEAFSAGSSPGENQQPNPLALQTLANNNIPTEGLFSKSWDAFAHEQSPRMDIVITVCDNAAEEACPVWPEHPATAHWGYPDPSRVQGSEEERLAAFQATFSLLKRRFEAFLALPLHEIDRKGLGEAARSLVHV